MGSAVFAADLERFEGHDPASGSLQLFIGDIHRRREVSKRSLMAVLF